MDNIRKEVLRCFKSLHRARKLVFKDDDRALAACRIKINGEFQKNKNISDSAAINEMLKFSQQVEVELRSSIIQAREVEPNKFELRITEETRKTDNVPYRDVDISEMHITGECSKQQ